MLELNERGRATLLGHGIPEELVERINSEEGMVPAPIWPMRLTDAGAELLRSRGVSEDLIADIELDTRTGEVSGVEPVAVREERAVLAELERQRAGARERAKRSRGNRREEYNEYMKGYMKGRRERAKEEG